MWCAKCQNELSECICPDIEERLRSACEGMNVALTFCKTCGLYYSRCTCGKPDKIIKSGNPAFDGKTPDELGVDNDA